MKLSNSTYDALKFFCITFFPAFITFYGVIASVCAIPYTQEALTIMSAFNAFLGALLGISNAKYNEDLEDVTAEGKANNKTDKS